MRAALRQLRFPAEFRIGRPVLNESELKALEQVAAALKGSDTVRPPAAPPNGTQHKLLADIATGLWRIRQRMLTPDSVEPLPEMRKAYRHLQSILDVMADAEIVILDHTGSPYNPGLALSVIAHQPAARLLRDEIIETIKPSVYIGDVMIQMGEVVVGIPEAAPDSVDRAL